MVETGAIVVGSISIFTLIITKLKCYAKKNGSCNYGCGFMDKSLIDDDEIDVKTIDLGESVHVMYVKNKKHHVPPPHIEPEAEYEYENIDDKSCFSVFKRSPFE
jgi:hypothetical protein